MPVRLERAQLGLLAATAAVVPVSVFASELLLALTALLFAARLVRRETRLESTPVDTPLLAFAVWTLLSASFAALPARSHVEAKKLLLFVVFYLAVDSLAPAEARERVLSAVLLGGLALAALMVVQYHFLGFQGLERRPRGFLGHYMTASGVTMVVLLVAAARLVFAPVRRPRARDVAPAALVLLGVAAVAATAGTSWATLGTRLFVAGLALLAGRVALAPGAGPGVPSAGLALVVAPLAAWALVVSQTRGTWVGAILGLTAIALVRSPRLVAALAAVVVVLALLLPAGLAGRLTMGDASSVDRYYMWQAGIDMVLDRPVFGQGPGMILSAYPRYRWPEAVNPQQPHLHNNVLQLAAERGVPGAAFFLWWAAVAAFTALGEARRARTGDGAAAATGVLAVVAAIFAAGLFEYNLGDSEVLMLVLLLVALPFALARGRAGSPASPA